MSSASYAHAGETLVIPLGFLTAMICLTIHGTEPPDRRGFENSPMASDKNNQSSSICLPNPEPGSRSTWKTLETQVGGHQFAHGEYDHQKLGMVDLGDGMVLKSLQNPPRGTRESSFYEKVFDPKCDDQDLLELRQFLSPFYGIEEKGKAKFLKLGNLTSGFLQPCVMDLKMGRVTYDEEATPEKIEHELSKYPPLKNLGFQITGMMRYNPETEAKEHFGKPYCRALDEENICKDALPCVFEVIGCAQWLLPQLQWSMLNPSFISSDGAFCANAKDKSIGRFFGLHDNDLRKDAIRPVLGKLKRLETWFLKQKKFSFIASSLLIIYEGSKIASNKFKLSEDAGHCLDGDPNGNLSTNKCSGKGALEVMEAASSSQDQNQKMKGAVKIDDSKAQKRLSQGDVASVDETVKKARLSDQNSDFLLLESGQLGNSPSPIVADVHLIDFAHAFPAKDIDQNFLFGLQKVISCLQNLLE